MAIEIERIINEIAKRIGGDVDIEQEIVNIITNSLVSKHNRDRFFMELVTCKLGEKQYYCFASGNGGIKYNQCIITASKDWDINEIENYLENKFGPFSGGHRGFHIIDLKYILERNL